MRSSLDQLSCFSLGALLLYTPVLLLCFCFCQEVFGRTASTLLNTCLARSILFLFLFFMCTAAAAAAAAAAAPVRVICTRYHTFPCAAQYQWHCRYLRPALNDACIVYFVFAATNDLTADCALCCFSCLTSNWTCCLVIFLLVLSDPRCNDHTAVCIWYVLYVLLHC